VKNTEHKTSFRAFSMEAIKNLKSSGTIAPSSRFLARKMVKHIDFRETDTIIEYGTGNGSITREILKQLPEEAKLLGFEINDNFFRMCGKIEDERFLLLKESACEVDTFCSRHGIQKADYVISSLPLAIFNDELIATILKKTLSVLKKGGKFIQFQYSLTSHKKLKDNFESVKLDFTLFNIPPAVIYVCN